MSVTSVMKRGLSNVKHPDVGVPKGWKGWAAETIGGAAASYALGQAHIQFRDSDNKIAKNLPATVGVVGKIGALIAGKGWIGTGLDIAGQAGVNLYFAQKGIEHALERTHRQVALTPPGVQFDTAKLPPGTKVDTVLGEDRQTVLGEIPQTAPGSRWLNRDQIDQIAAMR